VLVEKMRDEKREGFEARDEEDLILREKEY